MHPLILINPSPDVLQVILRPTLQENMMSMIIHKLISKLPNMSCHITNTKRWVTLWTILADHLRSKKINTLTFIYSRTWCWYFCEVLRIFSIKTPWKWLHFISLCSILPLVRMWKSLAMVLAICLCFINGDGGDGNFPASTGWCVGSIVDDPSSQEVLWVLWFVTWFHKINWIITSGDQINIHVEGTDVHFFVMFGLRMEFPRILHVLGGVVGVMDGLLLSSISLEKEFLIPRNKFHVFRVSVAFTSRWIHTYHLLCQPFPGIIKWWKWLVCRHGFHFIK